MLKRLISLGTAALAGITAACEEAPRTVAGTWRSPAAWSTMIHATRDGPLLVEVHGTPFDIPPSEFRATVAEAMSRQVIGRVTLFTADPEAARSPDIRVVIAFNPPDDLGPDALCEGRVATAAKAGETLAVHAAFCHGDKLLSSVRGWVARVDGPSDKRFRLLLGQIVRDLFPAPQ